MRVTVQLSTALLLSVSALAMSAPAQAQVAATPQSPADPQPAALRGDEQLDVEEPRGTGDRREIDL